MENKYVTDNSGGGFGWGGGGGAGIALLLLFLLILFAVFSRGGLGGHDGYGHGGHCGHGDGFGHNGIANAELWAQNFQRIPESRLQDAKEFGILKETITTGDWDIKKQITDTANEQRICQLQEALANKSEKINTLENIITKKEIENCIEHSAAITNARIGAIECQMLKKPEVEALAGIHPAGIVNFPIPVPAPYPPYPPYYPDRDKCCNPCNGGFTV